ncbi:TolC family protein [Hydrogenimonas sp.]
MTKKFVSLLLGLSLALHAQSYRDVLQAVDNALSLQSAQALEEAARLMAQAQRGLNLPALDAELSASYLKDTPTMYLHFGGPLGLAPAVPMGTKERWEGSLILSYPLFTGFVVTASIDKADLQHRLASLKRLDLKRNLYLQSTRLYGAIYAATQMLKAQRKGLEAIEAAYEKARGLYDNGLIPPADLYNIEAKKYAMLSRLKETEAKRRTLLSSLSRLINRPVDDIEGLAEGAGVPTQEVSLKRAMRMREDLKALEATLGIRDQEERLAKSRFYPTLDVAAAIDKQGDTLRLNGDGYTNADRSYVGARMRYNLFSGFADEKRLEAARARKLAAKLAMEDYKKEIATEIESAYYRLDALESRLQSAKMEIKARDEYYQLTLGRFENQLADADELSRAIADLAAARARKSAIESDIFTQKATIALQSGLQNFEKLYLAP